MFKTLLLAGAALAIATSASAKDLKAVGITVGSLGNPFFVAVGKGATDAAKQINPDVKVTIASADYDLNKQFTQIDNFIAAGVDMILVNAADPRAIAPAVKRAQAAGIVGHRRRRGGRRRGRDGADRQRAGRRDRLSIHGRQDRRQGQRHHPERAAGVRGDRPGQRAARRCWATISDIKILSDDQDGKGSRDGGLNVMQGYLTRFPDIDGVFTINDPQAIGSDLAAKQLNRSGIVITSVDGAPDIVAALKGPTQVQASASQDPYGMAQAGGGDRIRHHAGQEARRIR